MQRIDALAALGTDVSGAASPAEALDLAGLAGWQVEKHPAQVVVYGMEYPLSGTYATVTAAGRVLGTVGETYPVIQNEEAIPFIESLMDETGASLDMAGVLGSGFFLTLRLPGYLAVGDDKVETYLTVMNSHDGSRPFSVRVTPVTRGALVGCGDLVAFSARMRRRPPGAARQAVDAAFSRLEDLQRSAARLAASPMEVAAFGRMIYGEWGPATSDPKTVSRTERKLVQMADLFEVVRGDRTAWDAYVALCQWSDHRAPTRGATPDRARAEKALIETRFKTEAMGALRGWA